MPTQIFKANVRSVATAAVVPFLLFAVALGVRLYFLVQFPHVITLSEADAMGYIAIAKSIATTGGLGASSQHFPPFYPFLCAITYLFSPDMEVASRLTSLIMGAAMAVPLYLVGTEIADKRTGVISALVGAFFYDFIDFSIAPLSQQTYLTLFLLIVWLGIKAVKTPAFRYSVLLGLSCGALYLTRPEGIMAFVYMACLVLLVTMLDRSSSLRQKLSLMAGICASFLLVALPYVNYLHGLTGRWSISGKTGTTLLGIDASMKILSDGRTAGEVAAKSGSHQLLPQLAEMLRSYQTNLVKFMQIVPRDFSWIAIWFAVAGTLVLVGSVLTAKKGERVSRALILAPLLTGIVLILPVFAFSAISVAPSYILPLFVLLIITATRGVIACEELLVQLLARVKNLRALSLARFAPLSGVLALAFSAYALEPRLQDLSSPEYNYIMEEQKFLLKDTGIFLKHNTPPNCVVMSRWSNMAFYGDRRWIGLADGSIPQVVEYAKKHDVRYIVIDSAAVPRRRPQLLPLLESPFAGYEGLRVFHLSQQMGMAIIIYEVL